MRDSNRQTIFNSLLMYSTPRDSAVHSVVELICHISCVLKPNSHVTRSFLKWLGVPPLNELSIPI